MVSHMPTCRQAGFSYLWLMFLIAMVGIGLAAVGDQAGLARQRLTERHLLFAGHQIRDAIERYRAATPAGRPPEYPAQLSDLLEDRRQAEPMHHLRRLYPDPFTGSTDWGVVWLNNRVAGVFSRSDALPLKQDNFDSADAAFVGARRYSDWRFTSPVSLPADAFVSYR
jgi:type II secretory pathway pseudopilin PulG